MSSFLACGVAGLVLGEEERRLLSVLRPGGVVLFARNVSSPEQLRTLVGELRGLPGRPYVAVDLEGGSVNRLKALIGELPSAASAAAAGRDAVSALGRAAGAACAHFGFGVDFAPVLDAACANGWLAGEQRCFGADALEVCANAGLYLDALEGFGVSGCLKHYPGLGSGGVDSHHDLPLLDDRVREEAKAFHALAAPDRAVMVAHAIAPALGEGLAPASLSAAVIGPLHGLSCGPIIADDLGMGALAAYGSLAERAAAALLAGCDQVLLCNALEAREEVVRHVEGWAARDHRMAAATRRAEARARSFGRRELAPVAWEWVLDLAEEARRLAGIAA